VTIQIDRTIRRIGKELADKAFTLGELTTIAEKENISLSRLVVAEAMAKEG